MFKPLYDSCVRFGFIFECVFRLCICDYFNAIEKKIGVSVGHLQFLCSLNYSIFKWLLYGLIDFLFQPLSISDFIVGFM